MKAGDRYRAKNTMFWRADEKLKALGNDQRWVDFHRACGRCGLSFDDIDPVNDDPKKDVTDKMRGRGYNAVAVRIDRDARGFLIQRFVARGTGQDPVAAVVDAYRNAIASGDQVERGLEAIFEGPFVKVGARAEAEVDSDPEPAPAPVADDFDIDALIG